MSCKDAGMKPLNLIWVDTDESVLVEILRKRMWNALAFRCFLRVALGLRTSNVVGVGFVFFGRLHAKFRDERRAMKSKSLFGGRSGS